MLSTAVRIRTTDAQPSGGGAGMVAGASGGIVSCGFGGGGIMVRFALACMKATVSREATHGKR